MKVIKVKSNNFEDEVLDSKIPVIVDFSADWCGPCKMLGPILENVAESHDDIKFVSVNIDDEDDLAAKYDVFSIPCLVYIKDGKEVKRNVGLLSKNELEKFIEE